MIRKNLSIAFVFISLLAIHLNCKSQQVPYAREVISKLCSTAMKGRGYVENGDRNAANFIAEEFGKAGLKKYSKSYFQHFNTPVNSFPGKMSLVVNGKKLIPGEDFLIEPGAPGITGKFSVETLNADDLLSDDLWMPKVRSASAKFIVVNPYDKAKYSADQIKKSLDALEKIPEDSLLLPVGVGRRKLPSTVLGLLFHAAEHTQRHTGQLLVTVRVLTD